MTMTGIKSGMIALLLIGAATATIAAEPEDDRWVRLGRELADYRQHLAAVRREHGGVRKLPPVSFFLFGMGGRQNRAIAP